MRIETRMRLCAGAILVACGPGCGGETPPAPTAAAGSLAPTPELRAAMEYASAQALEGSRKTKPAIDAYRRVRKEYPESPQATLAAGRIKALGGR